ncbi:MAG: hypothetical protein HYZ00_03995 [Candidatus Hydrogenedentes bacterium]|nr:hypothetical protein [Candidatus Hydrogenedentota bacterium]
MMNKWFAVALSLTIALVVAGCGGKKAAAPPAGGEGDKESSGMKINLDDLKNLPAPAPAEPAPTPAPAEPAPAPAPAEPAPAPAPGAAAAPAAVPGELDPQQAKLIGTSWQVGDVEAAFQDGDTVMLKGGQIAGIMPDGLEAQYKYEGGKITLSALGQERTGTWDGEKLVVDGNVATKK